MDSEKSTTAATAEAKPDCAPLGLLGCPFCGEQPEYSPAAKDPNNPPYGWPHTLNHNCEVIGRQICIRCDYSKCEDTKEAVTAVWNTRWHPNSDYPTSH